MANEKLIQSRYQSLIEADSDKARDYLINQAFGRHESETLRAYCLSEIPKPRAPDKDASGCLRTLSGKTTTNHLKAAKKLCRLACGNWTRDRKQWLADPRTVTVMLERMKNCDEKVRKELIYTLGMISQRYDYEDLRIRDTLLEWFDQSSDALQIVIAGAMSHFGTPKVWKQVLSVIDHKPKMDARRTVGNAIARNCKKIRSKKVLQECGELMVRCLCEDNDDDTSGYLVGAIVALKKKRDVSVNEKSLPKPIRDEIRNFERLSW